MYYVYVIRSINRNYTYAGISDNVERRVEQHNKGYNRTTRPYKPFKLLLVEGLENRVEARIREKYYKTGRGREFLKTL